MKAAFDFRPVLTGERLELRPLRAEDFDDLYQAASDPLIWEQHPAPDRYQAEVFEKFFAEAMASGGALVAIDRQTGRIVGASRFHWYDQAKREVEIGWTFLVRSHWGGGCNREMKQLMLRHAFRFADRVVFLVGPRNLRSQKALEKIGAVRVGFGRDGAGRDSILYEVTGPPRS